MPEDAIFVPEANAEYFLYEPPHYHPSYSDDGYAKFTVLGKIGEKYEKAVVYAPLSGIGISAGQPNAPTTIRFGALEVAGLTATTGYSHFVGATITVQPGDVHVFRGLIVQWKAEWEAHKRFLESEDVRPITLQVVKQKIVVYTICSRPIK